MLIVMERDLINAVKQLNFDKVKELIGKNDNVNVNILYVGYDTLLTYALKADKLSIYNEMKIGEEYKKKMEEKSKKQSSSNDDEQWWDKAYRDHPRYKIIKLLLEKGADPNIGIIGMHGDHVKPLMVAIQNIYVEPTFYIILKLLLEKGADPNKGSMVNNNPNSEIINTPVHAIISLMIRHNNINRAESIVKLLKLFKKHNANFNIKRDTGYLLDTAVLIKENKQPEIIIKYLIDNGYVYFTTTRVVEYLIKNNIYNILELLRKINNCVNDNNKYYTITPILKYINKYNGKVANKQIIIDGTNSRIFTGKVLQHFTDLADNEDNDLDKEIYKTAFENNERYKREQTILSELLVKKRYLEGKNTEAIDTELKALMDPILPILKRTEKERVEKFSETLYQTRPRNKMSSRSRSRSY